MQRGPDDRKGSRRPRSGKEAPEGRRESERAAPPDDGGGQGSFTRPEDATVVGGDAEEGTPEHPAPDLHWGRSTGVQKHRDEEGT